MQEKVILHCDLNNFYASVEMQLNPELQGKAIAVCGDPAERHGIVLAKSYPAKAFGVTTGEPIWQAKKKCPQLITVSPNFKKYTEYSKRVFNIYVSYTPEVESFGLDECWLDVTGCQKLFGSGERIANLIREEVKEKTGLTISVGVSFTKVFAKLGSDMKKPDAVSIISRENFKTVAWRLPINEFLYVGRSTEKILNSVGIKTIGDIANTDACVLEHLLGKIGTSLHSAAWGETSDIVKLYYSTQIPKSVSHGTTTFRDINNNADARVVIYSLCEVIAFRLRRKSMMTRGVSISIRDSVLAVRSKQTKLLYATSSADDIAESAIRLLDSFYSFMTMLPLRSISVNAYSLISTIGGIQQTFFEKNPDKKQNLDSSIDRLREKYGFEIMKRGIVVSSDITQSSKHDDDSSTPFH
ncbi:MAG: DNA polymerase IV [Christensenellaceae bacterium]|jgi:DNA polymerase-4|nr:DNA polymerase IV [Christensenellaceae bacterium]